MKNKEAYLISQGFGMGQWLMLGFSSLLLLLALPILFGSNNPAFGLLWILSILAMNAPSWIWPVYAVHIDTEGFIIESPLRPSNFYPTSEFAEVTVVNTLTNVKTYLTFSDGRQYRVVLKLGFKQDMKLAFLDGPPFTETKKAANQFVRNAINAQHSA